MKILKEKQVVMLPTKGKSSIAIIGGKLQYHPSQIRMDNCTFQHLYITTDEEIREGDWFLYQTNETNSHWKNNTIHQCINVIKHDNDDIEVFDNRGDGKNTSCAQAKECKKIIATTDKSLLLKELESPYDPRSKTGVEPYPLPQLSQTFIKRYCKENGINEILVEYITTNRCCGRCNGIDDLCWIDSECDKHNITNCEKCFPVKGDITSLKVNSQNEVIDHFTKSKIRVFEDWHETHYEVVKHMVLNEDLFLYKIEQSNREDKGIGGMWVLAKDIANDFQKKFKYEEWIDLDHYETLWSFIDNYKV